MVAKQDYSRTFITAERTDCKRLKQRAGGISRCATTSSLIWDIILSFFTFYKTIAISVVFIHLLIWKWFVSEELNKEKTSF